MRASLFSFFAGAGFLDLGFESAGFSIDFVNELNKDFLEGYQYAHHQLKRPAPHLGYDNAGVEDYLTTEGSKIVASLISTARKTSNLIGFIAGPPCPDFSMAGKHKGGKGEKGRLTESYFHLISEQHPDFFVFENVPGLWKRHREFYNSARQILWDADYVTTEKMLNGLEFGVPQDRNRIFLLGFKRQFLKDASFTINGHNELPQDAFKWQKSPDKSRDAIINDHKWPATDDFEEGSERPAPEGIIESLTVEHWFLKNDVLKHPNHERQFIPKAQKRFETIAEGDISGKSFKRLHRWRYSPTAAYGNNEVHLHPYSKRRLSVAEALAVQSVPKEFAFPEQLSLSAMFKMTCNGVPYLLANTLALSLKDFLTELEQTG